MQVGHVLVIVNREKRTEPSPINLLGNEFER
jgi:hypothetical protein